MKGLVGSKLVGWGLVALCVFFIAQAAAGPNKPSKKLSSKETSASGETGSDTQSAKGGGGEVESAKTKSTNVSFPILSYYNISNYKGSDKNAISLHVSPEKFSQQMAYLEKNGYSVLSADKAYKILVGKADLPQKSVMLTFNDGYADFYLNAYPILRKYNFSALVFIITNRPGDANFMTWSQLKNISKNNITVGSQGVSNFNLSKTGSMRAKQEITISKSDIEGELGISVKYFAYPYGSYNTSIISLLDQSNYIAAYTAGNINASGLKSTFSVSRKIVEGDMSLAEFTKLLK